MQVKHQLLNFKRIKKIKSEVFFIFLLLTLYILSEIFDFSLLRCVFHEITGLHCPGCGVTRMIGSILCLDFYQAFRYNMLLVILLPFAVIYWIYLFVLKGQKRIPNLVWYLLLVIVIIFGILRNIPVFSYLAPTII